MRVRLESIGCRLNIGEIEALARQLAGRGCRVVGPGEVADLCIFNSCTVTSTASRKSRQILRQLRRSAPDAKLVATGCYSELSPEEVRSLGVDLVVANRDKDRMVDLLDEAELLWTDEMAHDDFPTPRAQDVGTRTRAVIKVQDGCDNRCTFCVVTIARGPGRSRPASEVIDEIEASSDSTTARWSSAASTSAPTATISNGRAALEDSSAGSSGKPTSLGSACRRSSPGTWNRGSSSSSPTARLMPHLHLPLQSGCDATLRRMARRTTGRNIAISWHRHGLRSPASPSPRTSWSGFPGETDDEFSQSLAFVEEIGFSRLHVFRFSSREGTPAASMPSQVSAALAQDRSRRLIELGAHLEHAHNQRFVGQKAQVLWEQGETVGPHRRWTGLTDNYIRCTTETAADTDLANRVTDTRLIATIAGGVLGEVDGITIAGPMQPVSARDPQFTILDS